MSLQTKLKRIVLTPGEPAGIGPDIVIQMAQISYDAALVAIADPDLLAARARLLNVPLKIKIIDQDDAPILHEAGTLQVIPVTLRETVVTGKLSQKNAAYVLATLELATKLCLAKKADAVVTGPVHKGIINDAGHVFSGHTEFFAEHCRVPKTLMLFLIEQMKVALVTTHLPLKNVSAAITETELLTAINLLHEGLIKHFAIPNPRILVCGLNPHAGEGGHLGTEEITTITPVVEDLRTHGLNLIGPLPADTLFTPKHLANADAVLAMYHDQALPLVKYLGFGKAVNMTLGLPFLRTSVDHGTALDLAGTGLADNGSLLAALNAAIHLS